MNIYQFVDTIEHTNEGVFTYHVAGDKNDFAGWIRDVLNDEVLYYQIVHEKERYWFVQKVHHRIKDLEEQAARSLGQQ
jgi:hypothetical protein